MEIEFVYYIINVKFIGIIGLNGKIIMMILVYEMLKVDLIKVLIVGNIGIVVSEVVYYVDGDEWIVMEFFLFQLMGIYVFRFEIGLILNVFDVYLDYYYSCENYEKVKQKVYLYQFESDMVIVN